MNNIIIRQPNLKFIKFIRNNNAYLSALVLVNGSDDSTIALSPTFSKKVFSYNATTTSSSVKVIPTAESSTATITVNGTIVTNGTASGTISLTAGAITVIIIQVISKTGLIQQYILGVYRPI